MSLLAMKLAKVLRISSSTTRISPSSVVGMQRSFKSLYSTGPDNGEKENELDDFLGEKPELQLHSVDPRKGWGFRGIHKAIICGKVGSKPVQKILRNGRTVVIFTVGTGGMFDQRLVGQRDLPKPAQWHRIAVHNDDVGAYVIKQITEDSSVYVEGEIETRVYNDSITGEVKNIPEICIRRDGKVRLVTGGKKVSDSAFDDLREGLFS